MSTRAELLPARFVPVTTIRRLCVPVAAHDLDQTTSADWRVLEYRSIVATFTPSSQTWALPRFGPLVLTKAMPRAVTLIDAARPAACA